MERTRLNERVDEKIALGEGNLRRSTHDRLIGGAGIEGVSGGVFGRAVLKEVLGNNLTENQWRRERRSRYLESWKGLG